MMESIFPTFATDVEGFITAAEAAEITAAAAAEPAPSSSSPPPPTPSNTFFQLLVLAYVQVGNFVMSEATAARWAAQLQACAAAAQGGASLRAAWEVCQRLVSAAPKGISHDYGACFSELASAAAAGPALPDEAEVAGGGLVRGAWEAAMDAVAARCLRSQAALYGAGEEAAARAATLLGIPPAELTARAAADGQRVQRRAALREAALSRVTDATAFVSTALQSAA